MIAFSLLQELDLSHEFRPDPNTLKRLAADALALLFPVPRKCRRPYLGCNSCLGGQSGANVALEITYSAEFSLYFSLFLAESSSLVTASSASQSLHFSVLVPFSGKDGFCGPKRTI